MRKSGKWQSVWDDRLLEWMAEHEAGGGPPRKIDADQRILISKGQIVRRLQAMEQHGLVTANNGTYRITERGRAYLREEVSVAEE